MNADAIGAFYYDKRLKNGTVRCKVKVFLLEVKSQRKRWPEKADRKTRWFALPKAAKIVQERVCDGCCAISTRSFRPATADNACGSGERMMPMDPEEIASTRL